MKPSRFGVVCALLALAGCSGKPAATAVERPRTGAEEKATRFFTAIIQKDWPAAYQCLEASSQARYSASQFAERGKSYYRGIGFEPAAVRVTGCEERGEEAIAHVALQGNAGTSPKHFNDAVSLRHNGSEWGVVLPASFGRTPAR
jgi:hypothetical protein